MDFSKLRAVEVVDSHTAGEPTRVVLSGGPDLGTGSMAARRERFRQQFDGFRAAVLAEPRGSDALVGALVCPPTDPSCCAGVVFFNNVGYLGMCGHGTIGVAVTLGFLGRIGFGPHRLETPAGVVTFDYLDRHRVAVDNVPSFRLAKDVPIEVDGVTITGDVAWGGNWFYLVREHGQRLERANVDALTAFAWKIRQELERGNVTGAHAAPIDHIELFGPPHRPDADSRNFVLCPGKAYDRSPCGTGTCAKLACLYADGKLREGAVWRQESILGTVFEASFRIVGESLVPRIVGSAYLTARGTLLFDADDPLPAEIGQ